MYIMKCIQHQWGCHTNGQMLSVLVSTISNSQVFLLKNVSSFFKCKIKLLTFFSINISIYAIFNSQSFNDMLTNNIVSFEQLGPDYDVLGVGGGGAGRGERGAVTSYIWHGTDVRAEWPSFSALPNIWLAPFFQQKVYDWPYFSCFVCERSHFSDILVNAYIFSLRDLARVLVLLVFNELTVIFV